jgi:hypothetical protein
MQLPVAQNDRRSDHCRKSIFTQAHFTLSTILHNQYIVSHFVIILVNSELHC